MNKSYIIILVLFLINILSLDAQYSGLRFSGHEELPDRRTGLELARGKPIIIKHDLDLSFDLKFQPNQSSYFGYVFRILSSHTNVDLVHTVLPDEPTNFHLIIGKDIGRISFHIPREQLTSEWITFRMKINLTDHIIQVFINDTVLEKEIIKWDESKEFRIFFGINNTDHFSTTDIPQMNIRDIRIRDDDKLKYYWPLDQVEGNIAFEIQKRADGLVTNPNWLLKLHSTWEKVLSIKIRGQAQFTYNPEDDIIYIFSNDSLYYFHIDDYSFTKTDLSEPHPILSVTSLLYDTLKNRIISYSVDHDFRSSFDFKELKWLEEPGEIIDLTEYWHHNRILTPDGRLYVFAGYGMYRYRNEVFRYNDQQNRWDSVNFSGDFLPRYLAGAGYNKSDSLFYFIGGYGSESGEQVSNPDYYYDIISYSFRDSVFRNVFEFRDLNMEFCYANSVIIDDASNSFYGFVYPKFQFENSLQLIRIPIEAPEIIKVGNPIDYKFLDIKSYADLYHSISNNKLVAVTSYYDNEDKTSLNIYTISYPPKESMVQKKHNRVNFLIVIIIFFGSLLLAMAVYWIFVWRRRKKISSGLSSDKKQVMSLYVDSLKVDNENIIESSIILFGGFQVIDRTGNDITAHFTPLLKRMLLYILLNSLRNNKGVSAGKLIEIFWFDKSPESASKNRSVNIAKLRTILESVGKTDITKDTGYWKLEFDPATTYIDYFELLQLTKMKKELSREQIIKVLSIADRGPFLLNTDADWLDAFKSEISNDIVDTLLGYIKRNDDEDPDFIIHLANCIFNFDIASEEAMKVKCRILVDLGKHSLAKQTFSIFIKEYELLYGEKFSQSFKEIIS